MKSTKELKEWLSTLTLPCVAAEEWRDINTYLGAFEQIKCERDIAIEQLKDLGYEFGEKI